MTVPLMRRTRCEAVAYLVADYWREYALAGGPDVPVRLMAHPLACVQAALSGETDPVALGVAPDSPVAELIREACRDRPCAGCGGTRWVEDENFEPEDYERGKPRIPEKGMIPCGACNLGGWDAPWPPPEATP